MKIIESLSSSTGIILSSAGAIIGGVTMNDMVAIAGIASTCIFAIIGINRAIRERRAEEFKKEEARLTNEKLGAEIDKLRAEIANIKRAK